MSAAGFTIRAQEPSDAAAVSAMLGAAGTFEGLLQLPDMPIASRLEYHEKVEAGACRLLAVSDEGAVIGLGGLHNSYASLRRAHVRTVGLGVAREWQGRGVGRALMQRMIDWADNWTTVLRIELTVHADNERAIALYRSLGFVEEGRHRAYAIKDGRFVDALTMARLHPHPPQIPA